MNKDFIGPVFSILRMTPEERKVLQEANPPEVEFINFDGLYLNWHWIAKGFGQLSVYKEGDQYIIGNECMSKDAVRSILYASIDKLLEDAKMEHE